MRAQEIKEAALELLAELESNWLEVVLVPSRDPDWQARGWMIRGVQMRNCEWYRKFCDEHQSSRKRKSFKSDTRIKRRDTVRALESIASTGEAIGIYQERLMPYITDRIKQLSIERSKAKAYTGGGQARRFGVEQFDITTLVRVAGTRPVLSP